MNRSVLLNGALPFAAGALLTILGSKYLFEWPLTDRGVIALFVSAVVAGFVSVRLVEFFSKDDTQAVARALEVPSKKWYESKIIWGAIVSVICAVVLFTTDVEVPENLKQDLRDAILNLVITKDITAFVIGLGGVMTGVWRIWYTDKQLELAPKYHHINEVVVDLEEAVKVAKK